MSGLSQHRNLFGCLAMVFGLSCWCGGLELDPARNRFVFGGVDFRPYAQALPIADSDLASTIFVRGLTDDRTRVLWRGSGPISHLKVSPGGNHVALLEYVEEMDALPGKANWVERQIARDGTVFTAYIYRNYVLRILNERGGEILSIEGVQHYVWSPSGQEIAYILGAPVENALGFEIEGVAIYDLSQNGTHKVHNSAYDLYWATHDGNLYLQLHTEKGDAVLRYDSTLKGIQETSHRGIYFSPGGTYYYSPTFHGSRFRVYLTAGDVDVTEQHPYLAANELLYPRSWLDDHTLLIPSPYDPVNEQVVVDLLSKGFEPVGNYALSAGAGSDALILIQEQRARRVPLDHIMGSARDPLPQKP